MPDTMVNAGGGLSKSKLALATATTSNVLAGKTFYAGDKELKTGTFTLASVAIRDKDGYTEPGTSKTLTCTISL